MKYRVTVFMAGEVVTFSTDNHRYVESIDGWFTMEATNGDFYHFDSKRVRYVKYVKKEQEDAD